MNVAKVWAVCFSATGTTRQTVSVIADTMAEKLGVQKGCFDFTLPGEREKGLCFSQDDLVVFGTPVYAGRVPNVLLKYLGTIEGNGAIAIPVVSFGNREYDDALIELRDILERSGMRPLAAGAFPGEHAFSDTLAKGRPDQKDLALARDFAQRAAEKLIAVQDALHIPQVHVAGVPYPYRGYYQPRDRQGNPVDIRKVKPLTNENCTDCKLCVSLCPLGSINYENVSEFTGICIKCGACIKGCPENAKYYDDEGYLYHKYELEEGLKRRAEPAVFL